MGLIADIQYALKRARAERYIEGELEKYEASLIRCVKQGVQRLPPVPMPLSTPMRSGWDDLLTDAEWRRLDKGRRELLEHYQGILRI